MNILEAMYQGCTVLAYHAPGPDMIIEEGVFGYCVSDTDGMLKLIHDDQHTIEQAMEKRISGSFTWESAAEHFDNCIRLKMRGYII